MLSSLFKPGWQSNSVQKRLNFLDNMAEDIVANADNQALLVTLASTDSDIAVRKAALHKLQQPESLFEIRQTHSDMATRAEADLIFRELIGQKSLISESKFKSLILKHPQSSSLISKLCPHENLRAELVSSLPLVEQAELIASIEYSSTRLLIANNLLITDHLEIARKSLRGKDKNAEKIVKTKLDAIHAKEKQEKENLETAERLCDSMEYLANHHEWRPEFKDQYLVTSKHWDSLDFTPSEYLNQSYEKAYNKVKFGIDERKKIKQAKTTQEEIAGGLELYCKKIAELPLTEQIQNLPTHTEKFNEATMQWTIQTKIIAPENKVSGNYSVAHLALEGLIKFIQEHDPAKYTDNATSSKTINNLIDKISWPKQYPDLQAKTELSEKLAEIKAKEQGAIKSEKDKLDNLHQKINRLAGSTKRGDLPRAKRELAIAIKQSNNYSGKDKLALDERLEKATIAVDKMADWKDFATEPKYLELCDAMEQLIGSKTHPDKLSVEINKLQQRWKALGHSESADKHWDRFKTAGDKAYAPCEVFFKQRHESRQKNLEKRKLIVNKAKELLDDTDWDGQPDYKQIEILLRNIGKDFQNIKDVERGPGQKQWNKFKKIKDAVYDKLSIVYDANIEIKNELIAQATALLESDIKEDSFSKLQLLQKKWKEVGVTRRKDDSIAWKKFKTATDNFYEKIQDARKEKRAEEDVHLNGYRNIIRDINKIARSAKDLADADSNFERLQTEYKALPPLPRGLPEKLVEGIAQDYKKANSAFNKSREQIIKQGKTRALDNLAKKAELCSAFEALPATTPAEELDDLKDQLANITISDNELRKRFDKRLAVAREMDRSEATEIRKLLCIDLEILLGVESPAEDKSQRMQIQLLRMQKGGFGQERADTAATLKKLKLDWYCLPGAEPAMQTQLDERFKRLIQTK